MRLIDADCLILKKGALRWRFETEHDFRQMFEIIGNAETVYKIPEVHGRWEKFGYDLRCSACGVYQCGFYIGMTNYCPSCGAKMDGDEP